MGLEFEQALRGKRIFVTGHTGFTGSWLCCWLTQAGAQVYGYALAPEPEQRLYALTGVASDITSVFGDILDYEKLAASMADARPDVVIHLAAQPLVRRSYREPLQTFAVNVMGTANVLEAARNLRSVRGVVAITTDKVYENNEWPWAYRENDPLGGKDPYSASKSAAEMVIKGYASSFPGADGNPYIATARGGNIVGGGDWSENRLIPDYVRAINAGSTLELRYPDATRPWQHVLALVQAYAMLSAGLLSDRPQTYAKAWNLGPAEAKMFPVREIVTMLSDAWAAPNLVYSDDPLPEAHALALDSRLAQNVIGWNVPWPVETMIRETALWYREYYQLEKSGQSGPGSMRDFTIGQINRWRSELAT